MTRVSRCTLALAVLVALAGCASTPTIPVKTPLTVVLLPQANAQGQPMATSVTIQTPKAHMVLAQPLAMGQASAAGMLVQRRASVPEVQVRWADLLRVQPPSAEGTVLDVVPESGSLTPAAEARLPELIQRAQVRAGGEMVVIGHTDRVGSEQRNDALSRERAQAVAERLQALGFPASRITVVGRGEREPLVPTADEVAEPRNHRIEVLIR